jgi:serine/threonine protein kinase/WD40 repeat protein
MVGTTISHYRITEKLGEGGMGVVYKAEDTRLDRPVALKFLAAHAIEDPEHKARFVREAKAAARLDHSNICSVYEIDEEEGQTFLAMAFLEGHTVKDKVAERPLKLAEALDIAVQTAQGLQAAHEKDIVHRDIKSVNLMVSPQGQVTIMDFGLAQLAERSKLTETTTILGTPSYMSPEQAVGEKTDRSTDLWSLGVVLYEMVTGRLPFEGERQEAVLYKIGSEEPEPVTALRAGLPMELEWIVGKALAKDRGERYQHADDLLVDLRNLQKKLASGKSTILKTQAASQTEVGPRTSAEEIERQDRRKQTVLLGAAALGVLLALVFAFFPLFSPSPGTESPLRKLVIPVEAGIRNATITPNGQQILFQDDSRKVWVRDLDQFEARPLAGVEGFRTPCISPDNRFIAYLDGTELKKVSLQGGPITTLCEASTSSTMSGCSWSPDGSSIVFSNREGLFEVASQGGAPVAVYIDEGFGSDAYFAFPHFLPSEGQRKLLFATGGEFNFASGREPSFHVVDLATGERQHLGSGTLAVYSPTGQILYQSRPAGDLWALPFSLEQAKAVGNPFPVAQNTESHSVSKDGTLVYLRAVVGGGRELLWRDRAGNKLGRIGQPQDGIRHLALSPDSRRVAVSAAEGGNRDIWIHEVDRPLMTRLTQHEGTDLAPAWSPGGDRLAYSSDRNGEGDRDLFIIPADGSRDPIQILSAPKFRNYITDWSPDEKIVFFFRGGIGGVNYDLFYLRKKEDGSSYDEVPFLQSRFHERTATLSPDGRYVAYSADESGEYEVYIRRFSDAGGLRRVSFNGGAGPRWRVDGKELFYVEGDRLMAVRVSTDPELKVGIPEPLFSSPGLPVSNVNVLAYDVTRDGQRFVVSEPIETGEEVLESIRVVENWHEEFRDREQD